MCCALVGVHDAKVMTFHKNLLLFIFALWSASVAITVAFPLYQYTNPYSYHYLHGNTEQSTFTYPYHFNDRDYHHDGYTPFLTTYDARLPWGNGQSIFPAVDHQDGRVTQLPAWYRHHYTDIVGGVPYSETQWAGQTPNFYARIAVRVRPFYDNPASCGATVIGPNVLISAGHCFKFHNDLDYVPLPFLFVPKIFLHVHIGATDTDDKGVSIGIEDIYIPISFDAGKREGDVAVIILKDVIPVEAYEPIRVMEAPTGGADGYTFAMGLTNAEMKPSEFRPLKLAHLYIRPQSSCRSHQLCSRTISTTSGGLCTHDSGSPLLLLQNGHFVLVGISRSAAPVTCIPVMKTHYYTSLTPYLDDLGVFISGELPPNWVKYTHGTRLVWK